jgi:hypothetical protein
VLAQGGSTQEDWPGGGKHHNVPEELSRNEAVYEKATGARVTSIFQEAREELKAFSV